MPPFDYTFYFDIHVVLMELTLLWKRSIKNGSKSKTTKFFISDFSKIEFSSTFDVSGFLRFWRMI